MIFRTPVRQALASPLFAIVLACASQGAAGSTSTSEITDMWWNPAESGWGVNVIMQNNVAFMTFFVYDSSQNPVWYTAELRNQGSFVWSGGLYATKGPWFGGAFPPANVTRRQAGTASFTLGDLYDATLAYTVDGVTVSKPLQRQTWTYEDISGNYAGGYSVAMSGCTLASRNGVQELSGLLTVTQKGTAVSIDAAGAGLNCTFAGTYSQFGKLGQVAGSYGCSDDARGTFTMYDLTPTVHGFTAHVIGQSQFCQWTGYIGGISRAQ